MPKADSTIPAMLDSLASPVDLEVVHVWVSVYDAIEDDECSALNLAGYEHFRPYYSQRDLPSDIGVTSRVSIGPGFKGYVLCVPGMYSSTVRDLWVYDQKAVRWLPPVELADDWGDAGEWYEAHSWLLDLNADGYRDILKRGKHGFWEECYFDELARQLFIEEAYAGPEIVADSVLRARYDFEDLCK